MTLNIEVTSRHLLINYDINDNVSLHLHWFCQRRMFSRKSMTLRTFTGDGEMRRSRYLFLSYVMCCRCCAWDFGIDWRAY